jgi:hypothetical protein
MYDNVQTAPAFLTILMTKFRYGVRGKAFRAPPRGTGSVQALQIQEANMSLSAWIVLGLVAGFIASKIVSGSGQGVVMDIVLGIVGAALLLVVYHAVPR